MLDGELSGPSRLYRPQLRREKGVERSRTRTIGWGRFQADKVQDLETGDLTKTVHSKHVSWGNPTGLKAYLENREYVAVDLKGLLVNSRWESWVETLRQSSRNNCFVWNDGQRRRMRL